MARLNINFEPVPEVAPTGAPQGDYFHQQASPAAFGAPVAQGLETLGHGIERGAEAGFDALEFHEKVAADYEVNNFIDARTRIEYGDPTKTTTGPDGNPVRDTGYFGTTGRVSLDRQQATLQSIADARQRGLQNLSTPRARLEYDAATRRMYSDSQMRISAHADQQQKVWAQGVNSTGADLNLNGYAASIIDHPEAADGYYHRYIDSRVKAAQLKFGNDPSITNDVVADAKRDLLEAQVNAVAVKDPANAIRILEQNRETAGVKYDDIYNRLRARSTHADGVNAANNAILAATSLNGPSTTVAGNQNAPASVRYNNPGAMWMGPVAQRWGATSAVGLPGGNNIAVFGNPVNGAAAHIDLLRSNYAGMTLSSAVTKWSGGNSSTAYSDFITKKTGIGPDTVLTRDMLSGPEGIAIAKAQSEWEAGRASPITDEQWRQAADLVAKGGQALPGVTPPTGGATFTPTAGGMPGTTPPTPGTTAPPAVPDRHVQLAEALRNLESNPDLSDEARQIGRQRIEQEFRTLDIIDNQTTKARTEANDAAASGYVTKLADALHTPGADLVALQGQIAHDDKLNWQTRAHLLDRVAKYSGEEQRIGYGPGFFDAKSRLLSHPGTEGHIGTVEDILNLPDNAVTMAGQRELVSIFGELRKEDQGPLQEAKHGAEQRIMLQMVRPDETGGFVKDIHGQQMFNGSFLPMYNAAYSQWVKDGHNPWEFLTDTKKADAIAEQAYPKRQRDANNVFNRGDQAAQKGPTAEELPATPQGINPAGWVPLVGAPPVTATGKPWPLSNWAQVLQRLASDPSDENKTAFKEKFGLDPDEVLGKFKMAPENAAPPEPQNEPPQPGIMDWLRTRDPNSPGNPLRPIGRFLNGEPELPDLKVPSELTEPSRRRQALEGELASLATREEHLNASSLHGEFTKSQLRSIAARRTEINAELKTH